MTNSYTNIFGGSAVKPAQSSYLSLSISSNVLLAWPLESAEGVPYVASQIDIAPTASSLLLGMPDATLGSLGPVSTISNTGANAFTITDNSGNSIQTVTPGQTFLITLTSNATANGMWRSVLMGSTGSASSAASLAGPGLQVKGTYLTPGPNTTTLTSNTTLTEAYRNVLVVWNGGASSVLLLDLLANVLSAASAWEVSIMNVTGSAVTIATSGADTINGLSTLNLPANAACTIVASPTGFNTSSLGGAAPTVASFNAQTLPLVLTGTSQTLTSAQATNFRFLLTGTLSAAFTLSFPQLAGLWVVENTTSGGYPVIVNTTAAANSITVLPGQRTMVLSDGSNVIAPFTDGSALWLYGKSPDLELSSIWLR